ncbi:hypothetical protein PN498_02620 [Oscillatoria sp. CS-180]|uniref:hypothetical protein n=1 Tax=Oscillatoria sp. CS-180 TaxID=3021720 RepID=UPI00232DC47E|nr:hypothetical protein [Oscillatoria sp. CS-180]MDB9524869.1 hypothetical protein [Oscillatoria sp. CS-180]
MGIEFLIVTIYLICVVYVLYQMALSVEDKLEDQVKIVLDGDILESEIATQLQQQKLYQAETEIQTDKTARLKMTFFNQQEEAIGNVTLQVTPFGKQTLEPPIRNLDVSIVNTLPNQQVFINWDYSSISVYGNSAQRVIRGVPGNPIDLHTPQVVTVVNPGLQTTVPVTNEGLLSRSENQIALGSGAALVDLKKIPNMKESLRHYSLQILMWVRSMSDPDSPALQLLIPFVFKIEVLPDHVALPVLSWLLKFNPFSPKPSQKTR